MALEPINSTFIIFFCVVCVHDFPNLVFKHLVHQQSHDGILKLNGDKMKRYANFFGLSTPKFHSNCTYTRRWKDPVEAFRYSTYLRVRISYLARVH